MRYFFLLIACALLSSCASRVSTTELNKEADDLRVQLMRKESDVYGDFFRLRVFHSDLLQSVNSIAATPYPHLDTIFKSSINEANGAVLQRMIFDTTYFAIKKESEGKKYLSKKGASGDLLKKYDVLKSKLPAEQVRYADQYFVIRKAYQDTCMKYKILRYGPEDYAGVINEKIVFWQDSLEEVGRMIAREKADLNARHNNKKSPEFFAEYKPVSELEAKMKTFDSLLSQLQNSLSRFEEGNKEDFIYFGPHVRPRLEVQATEDLFGQISILMKDCREKEREYWDR